jgi:hypothetical protein
VAEAGRPEPDEAAHRAFAKRASEARGAIDQARTVRGQAELDLIHSTELAKVALDGLLAARAGADWRALDHARQARAHAAAGVGPAWEALRCAGLRIAEPSTSSTAWSRSGSPPAPSEPGPGLWTTVRTAFGGGLPSQKGPHRRRARVRPAVQPPSSGGRTARSAGWRRRPRPGASATLVAADSSTRRC